MSPAPAPPVEARIRSYNVGFGDCFLLTLAYASGNKRHVLIDFGSTKFSGHGASDMEQVGRQIAKDCDGKLHMVVATHRHADHISGFADAGDIIADLDPDLVVQPWTERPDLAPEAEAPVGGSAGGAKSLAARAAVARLADMHVIAGLIEEEARRLRAAGTGKKTVIDQLEFLGMENINNRKAVLALAELGREQVYAHFGTKLPIRKLLPGVRIDVLGPPTVEQYGKVRKQVHSHPTEFWHLAASRAQRGLAATTQPLFPAEASEEVPPEARWVIPQIDQMNAEELLSLVRILDKAMNNTSLILLFDVGGTLLLFPGDAQIENWSYCLRDAPNAAEIRARIAQTRLYKVGHHASLNATPKTLLWDAFERRDDPDPAQRLVTLVSTLGGKHGSESRGTEVPRRPLMDELELRSELHNTQRLRSRKEFWLDVTLSL